MAEKHSPGSSSPSVSREQLIELLNEDLAREYQAIIAYVVYSQVLKGAQYMNIAAELEKLDFAPFDFHGFLDWDRSGPYVVGVAVAVAGLYELTPLKSICLKHCRSPLHFLLGTFYCRRIGRSPCAVIGCPGQSGQTSLAALSHKVKTKSGFGALD